MRARRVNNAVPAAIALHSTIKYVELKISDRAALIKAMLRDSPWTLFVRQHIVVTSKSILLAIPPKSLRPKIVRHAALCSCHSRSLLASFRTDSPRTPVATQMQILNAFPRCGCLGEVCGGAMPKDIEDRQCLLSLHLRPSRYRRPVGLRTLKRTAVVTARAVLHTG